MPRTGAAGADGNLSSLRRRAAPLTSDVITRVPDRRGQVVEEVLVVAEGAEHANGAEEVFVALEAEDAPADAP